MKLGLVITAAAALACSAGAEDRVLVYTRNFVTGGKGFVHDNIATNVAAIQAMAPKAGFAVDVSDQPSVFTDDNLKKYRAIVFANSNNEAFENDAQREAFKRYIHAGGGFAGIHSATGSERKWPWYWELIGGTFARHAKMQKFTVKVVDRNHPSTAGYPSDSFEWEDEFYYMKSMPAGLRILLAGDMAKLDDPQKDKSRDPVYTKDNLHPLAWCHEFEGGRAWYTALGHQKKHYDDVLFRKHLLGGILWAMGRTGQL